MNWLVALWLALQSTPAESTAFRSTAPAYLTSAQAIEHLGAARIAGARYNVDPALLLSIAMHESNYRVRTVTIEPGHRVSCGVMTPTPQARCSLGELTAIGGYAAGAAHLRVWLDVCRENSWCALTAYAGGRGLVRACSHGTRIVRPGVDACEVVYQFRHRAAVIRRALQGAQ